jgi:hypothetical protein
MTPSFSPRFRLGEQFAMPGAYEVLCLIFDPLDRTAQLPQQIRHQKILGIIKKFDAK